MNRIYRSIWNATLGAWVAAPETARTGGGGGGCASTAAVVGCGGVPVTRPLRWHQVAGAIAMAWGMLAAAPAQAVCTGGVATVTCSGITSEKQFFDTDNLSFTVVNGARIQTTEAGSPAVKLTGTGVTVRNSGFIGPDTTIGVPTGITGLQIDSSGTVNVVNDGTLKSAPGPMGSLDGQALVVRNGAGSISALTNSGTIDSNAQEGVADIPVIAMYGGAQNVVNNSGTITGRVALQASAEGNTFTNSGTINGSVHLGAGGGSNTFHAITGSSVNKGNGVGGDLEGPTGIGLAYAATGVVNGGSANNGNTLKLMNATDSGTDSTGTINGNNYVNFNNLTVSSGTWTLTEQLFKTGTTNPNVNLKGGQLNVDSAALTGARITANGGALGAATAGTVVASGITLGTYGLTVNNSTNDLTLNGVLTGSGALTKDGTGTLTLDNTNNFGGGVFINGGKLILGRLGSISTVNTITAGDDDTAELETSITRNLSNQVQLNGNLTLTGTYDLTLSGKISGTGGLSKAGTNTLTLSGANDFTGNSTLAGGTLVLTNNTALGSGQLTLTSNSSLLADGLNVGNAINVGSHTLTLTNTAASTLSGVLSGTGAIIKNGAGDLTLTGANTFSGVLALATGKLIVGHNSALGIGSLQTGANTTLDADAARSVSNNLVLLGNLNIAGSNDLALNGQISGNGNLTKNGQASLTLGGANTFIGNTSLEAGTLVLGSDTALGDSVNQLLTGAGTTLDANTEVSIVNGVQLGAGGNLNIRGTSALGLNGVISGVTGAGLTKSGTADLILNGNNTYTGDTQLDAGRLFVGNANALGKGKLIAAAGTTLASNTPLNLDNEISLNGAVNVGGTHGLTLSGPISGTGSLVKVGTGTLTLAGTNTSTGTTTISEGGLVASVASLASGAITNNAALELNQATDATLTQAISGSGSFTKTGAGTLTLAGANTSTGTTTISAGGLVASVANLAIGAITNNAALELNQASDATLIQAISGSGSFTKTGASTLTLAGTNTSTGTTTISAGGLVASVANLASGAITNNAALELNQARDATLSQTISGAGSFTKTGAGALTLSGDSSSYLGSTRVAGGSLLLGNTAQLGGTVTVGSGATLAGTGTVGSAGTTTTVQSGAMITVGDASTPYGMLHVAGDLVLEHGATYLVQADPTSASSSLIHVAGNATLGGSVLHVGNASNASTDFQVGQTYTILHANQISGTFSGATSNYAYLDAALGYVQTNGATSDVTLQLQRKSVPVIPGTPGAPIQFADLAQTSNQAGTAHAIEGLGRGNALFDHIETLPTGAPPAALAQLSADMHSNVGSSLVGLGAFAPSVSIEHLRSNTTAGLYPGAAVAQSDGPLPASAWPSSKAQPAWAEVVGHWQRYDGDGNAATLKQRTTGLFLGMDQEVGTSGWRVGGSLGYTHAEGKVADRASESDVNSYSAAFYGGKSFGTGVGPRINVLGGLAYTWHDIVTTRNVESLGQTLKADYSAHSAQLFAEVGYAIGQYEKFGVEPFVGVSLGQQRTGSFQEKGGFAALSGKSNTDDLTSTTLGVRVRSDFQVAGKDARLRATVGWRHAFGDVTASKTMAFEGGQNFTVAGAPLARNTAVLGLEGEVALSRNAALVLGYRGELGSGQRDHAANVKLRWAF